MADTATRTALVTGSTGFLGGWVMEALRARCFRVVGAARRVAVGRDTQRGEESDCQTVAADLTDSNALAAALEQHRIDVVVHLAAQSKVPAARLDPGGTFETNVKGTWTLLEAIRLCKRTIGVVLCSTDAVYGESGETPSTEQSPLRCTEPYAVSKACAEQLGVCYHATFGVPVVVARCSNVFGPGDADRTRIVPGTICRLLRGEPPQIRGDGQALRDYVFVRDAAGALALLAEHASSPDVAGQRFNVAAGEPLSVLQIVQRLIRLAGRPDLQPQVGQAAGEVSRRLASADRIRRVLGWTPRISMDEALRETFEWYRQNTCSDS